jgi:hypothetical protein
VKSLTTNAHFPRNGARRGGVKTTGETQCSLGFA